MGERGPVPKRSEERRRRNKTDESGQQYVPDRVDMTEFDGGNVVPTPEPNPNWHPAALAIWEAAADSGQRVFFEKSDWAVLALLCSQITQHYRDDLVIEKVKLPMENGSGGGEEVIYGSVPMNGGTISAILKGFASLGLTEGDRRRMRLELKRDGAGEEKQTPEGVVDARERFLGGA